MNKYNIEGGLKFFEELYNSLDNEEIFDEDNRCLITNEPLSDKFVELECKHKFNYIPLYYDVLNHKKKFNCLENNSGKLSLEEIRCPYCRHKQKGLLPYYEELGLQKVNGINFYDPTEKIDTNMNYSSGHKCQYNIPNALFDATKPESNLNLKFYECYSYNASKIQIYNSALSSQPITYNDNNYYCYYHKLAMIKQHKKDAKLKEKQDKKDAKLKEKQEKLAAKQKEKEEKEQAKKLLKEQKLLAKTSKSILSGKNIQNNENNENTINNENIVLGPTIVTVQGCIQILKTGPNKGNPCGCKKISESEYCLRHYKLINNIIINN